MTAGRARTVTQNGAKATVVTTVKSDRKAEALIVAMFKQGYRLDQQSTRKFLRRKHTLTFTRV
jgi:hypothetical protein